MILARSFIAVLAACLFSTPVSAQRTYFIGKDESGVYLQTANHGRWHIDKEDFENVRIGETGSYAIGLDHTGTFIMTDKHGKIYIELEADKQFEREIWSYDIKHNKFASHLKTKYFIFGNHILVPAILGYGSKETEALLLLDTGASTIILHQELADRLNVKQTQKTTFMLPGGQEIMAKGAKLNFVNLGPHKKTSIYAAFIDHKGSPVPYQGFLGMNFLRGIEFQIDYKNRVIWWKP